MSDPKHSSGPAKDEYRPLFSEQTRTVIYIVGHHQQRGSQLCQSYPGQLVDHGGRLSRRQSRSNLQPHAHGRQIIS